MKASWRGGQHGGVMFNLFVVLASEETEAGKALVAKLLGEAGRKADVLIWTPRHVAAMRTRRAFMEATHNRNLDEEDLPSAADTGYFESLSRRYENGIGILIVPEPERDHLEQTLTQKIALTPERVVKVTFADGAILGADACEPA